MIKRAQQALRNAIDPALADLGLTKAQYAALYNLRRHPGPPAPSWRGCRS